MFVVEAEHMLDVSGEVSHMRGWIYGNCIHRVISCTAMSHHTDRIIDHPGCM